jgi:hypothetical protein
MPGLAELEAGHADVDGRYAEIPEGGRIDYTTDDHRKVTCRSCMRTKEYQRLSWEV